MYNRNTTTCFGPISGPFSGCDLAYRAAIQDMWGVLLRVLGFYIRNTTTCFGSIRGPSSERDLTYRAAIQDMWGVLLTVVGIGCWVWGERDPVVSIVGTMT